MHEALRRAWMEIVTAADYDQHMAAIGQAQGAAALTAGLLQDARLGAGAHVVIAGAGTGQMLDYLSPGVLAPYRLTCTDLNHGYFVRLKARLATRQLHADLVVDDFEATSLAPGCDLLLATLVLEHLVWTAGVHTIGALRPAYAAIILQENPPGMDTAVTPGRTVPPSIERALRSAQSTLVPRTDLIHKMAEAGFVLRTASGCTVADGKRLAALLFAAHGCVPSKRRASGIT